MAMGPGKYDAIATAARIATKADGVVVIVFGGFRGSGFSVQATEDLTPKLPGILRAVADDIERSLKSEPEPIR